MNTDSVNKWLTLAANVGVIAGIVFLGVEIQQNTNMMQAEMSQSRTDSAMQFQSMWSDDYLPSILIKLEDSVELTREEQRRFQNYFRAFNRNQENTLWQFQNGYLNDSTPRNVRNAVSDVVGASKISLDVWNQTKLGYSDEYIAFVDDVIADIQE